MPTIRLRGTTVPGRPSGSARLQRDPSAINKPNLGNTRLLWKPLGNRYEYFLDFDTVPSGVVLAEVKITWHAGRGNQEERRLSPVTGGHGVIPLGEDDGVALNNNAKAWVTIINVLSGGSTIGIPTKIPIAQYDIEAEPDVAFVSPGPELDGDTAIAGSTISWSQGTVIGEFNELIPTVISWVAQDSASLSPAVWETIPGSGNNPTTWPAAVRSGRGHVSLFVTVTGKGGPITARTNAIDFDMPAPDPLEVPDLTFGISELRYDNAVADQDYAIPVITAINNPPPGTYGTHYWLGWSKDFQVPPRLNQREIAAQAMILSGGKWRPYMSLSGVGGNPYLQSPRTDYSVDRASQDGVLIDPSHQNWQYCFVRPGTPVEVGPFTNKIEAQDMPAPSVVTSPLLTSPGPTSPVSSPAPTSPTSPTSPPVSSPVSSPAPTSPTVSSPSTDDGKTSPNWAPVTIRTQNQFNAGLAGGAGWQFLRGYASCPMLPASPNAWDPRELLVMSMDQNTFWWSDNFGGTVLTPRLVGGWGLFNTCSAWVDPTNPNHWIMSGHAAVGTDIDLIDATGDQEPTFSGAYETLDRGKTCRQIASFTVVSAQVSGSRWNRNCIAHDPTTTGNNRHIYIATNKRTNGSSTSLSRVQLYRSTVNGGPMDAWGPALPPSVWADEEHGVFGLVFLPNGTLLARTKRGIFMSTDKGATEAGWIRLSERWWKVSGTGNGTISNFDINDSTTAQGTWTLTCLTGGATGTFRVNNPAGTNVGTATVGTLYNADNIQFRINDGSTDFGVGAVLKFNTHPWPAIMCSELCVQNNDIWWATFTNTGQSPNAAAGIYKTTNRGARGIRNTGAITLLNGSSGGTMGNRKIMYFKLSHHSGNNLVCLEDGRRRCLVTDNGGDNWKEAANTNWAGSSNSDDMGDSDGSAIGFWHYGKADEVFLQRKLTLGLLQNANNRNTAISVQSGSLFEGTHWRDVGWHPSDPNKFLVANQDRTIIYTDTGGDWFYGMNAYAGSAIINVVETRLGLGNVAVQASSCFMIENDRGFMLIGKNGAGKVLCILDDLDQGDQFNWTVPIRSGTAGWKTGAYEHPAAHDPMDPDTRGYIGKFAISNANAASRDDVNIREFTDAKLFAGLSLKIKSDMSGAGEKKSGTGNGTITNVDVTTTARRGRYKLTCLTGGATATWRVEDPRGVNIGTATTGTLFNVNGFSVRVNDGSVDWATGAIIHVKPYQTIIYGVNENASQNVYESDDYGVTWTQWRNVGRDFKIFGGATPGVITWSMHEDKMAFAAVKGSKAQRIRGGSEVVIMDATDPVRPEYCELEVAGYTLKGYERKLADLDILSVSLDPHDRNIAYCMFRSHHISKMALMTTTLNGSFLKRSGVGNGTVTDIEVTGGATYGKWSINFSSATAFTVKNPAGTTIGSAGTVGTPWTGGNIAFTVNAGGTAWANGAIVDLWPYPIWINISENAVQAAAKIVQSPHSGCAWVYGSHGIQVHKNPSGYNTAQGVTTDMDHYKRHHDYMEGAT